MISKEQFCEIIQHFGLILDAERRVQNVVRDPLYDSLDLDFVCVNVSNPRIEQDLIDVLENMFQDKSHWISYYIGDLACGTHWHPGMITDTNGNDIPLQCAADLWNLLMENFI